MRALSTAGLSRRYAEGQQVTWMLQLAANGWAWRGATLPTTLDGIDFPARLAGVERWREALAVTDRPGGLVKGEAEIQVLDLPDDADSLRGRLATTPPVGLEATLRLAWLGDDGLTSQDTVTLLYGRVTSWRVEALGVRLTLVDVLQALGPRRIGRLLRPRMIDEADSPSLGRTLPWVLGRVEDAELLPLRVGVEGRLARSLAADERIIPLVSLDGFPSTGHVQIGEEIIEYTTSDTPGLTLGDSGLLVTRGEKPADHARGTTVRLLPTDGLCWIVADHPCKVVEAVYADGLPVAPATWSVATRDLGARQSTVINMTHWPLGEDGREASRISATVQGQMDEQGTLIENPARMIAWMLTDRLWANLGSIQIDQAAVDAVATELAARQYLFARRLTGNETLGDLLGSAAHEAGVWIGGGEPIRLIIADPTPRPERVQEDLDDTKALEALAPADIRAPDGMLAPDAVELIGSARAQGRGRPTFQFPTESVVSGLIPRRFPMAWLDMGRDRAAGDMGELIWAHLGDPPFESRQEYPLGAALLTAGETVRVTSDRLDLKETLAWVAALEVSGAGRVRLDLRGPWAGDYCWKLDENNFIRRYAFGRQMCLVNNGYPAARLSQAGSLRLGGRLHEGASLTAGPFTAPVAWSGGWLYLCHGAGGSFTPFMRFDMLGNAELTGTVREHSAPAIATGGQALGSEAGRFWLAPDTIAGSMEYVASTRTLNLKGILIESVRL